MVNLATRNVRRSLVISRHVFTNAWFDDSNCTLPTVGWWVSLSPSRMITQAGSKHNGVTLDLESLRYTF